MVDSMSQKVALMSSIMATRPGKANLPHVMGDFDTHKDVRILKCHVPSRYMGLQVPEYLWLGPFFLYEEVRGDGASAGLTVGRDTRPT